MRTELPEDTDPARRHPNDGWRIAEPLRVSARTRSVLTRIIDAIIPPAPRRPSTVEEIADQVLRLLRYMPGSTVMGFAVGLHALNWSPIWRLRGWLPLSRLDRAGARRHLGEIASSRWLPVRLLMLGPQGLIMSTYFDQDYAHEAISYAPRGFIRERIQLRKRWVEGVEPSGSAEIHHRPKDVR